MKNFFLGLLIVGFTFNITYCESLSEETNSFQEKRLYYVTVNSVTLIKRGSGEHQDLFKTPFFCGKRAR